MPILFITPPPEPVEPTPIPKIPDRPCKTIQWTSAGGETISFDSPPISMIPGRSGFGRVAFDVVSDRLVDGSSYVQNYRPSTRVVSLPFQVKTGNLELMSETYNRLDRAFRHKDYTGDIQPGELRVIRHDNTSRRIKAFYQGGYDGTEDLDDQVLGLQTFPNLEFWCPDHAWRADEVVLEWAVVQDDPRAFYPIYPIKLNSSDIGGIRNFTNNSQEPIYPVWEITGPGTPRLEETTSGAFLQFDEEVPAETTVTIDTRPISIEPETGHTIVDDLGESWWGRVSGELFSIPTGPVQIDFSMVGADANSRLKLTYEERHGRAW